MSLVAGPGRAGSRQDALPDELRLCVEQHINYIKSLDKRKDELEYWLTEHLRMSGIYWGLTATFLLNAPDTLSREGLLNFVFSCLHDNGGFGAAPGHDPHLLSTVYAVQILTTLDALQELDKRVPDGRQAVGRYFASLQDSVTGSFAGDEWGEVDTRFLYAALNALSLLGLTHLVNVDKAIDFILSCQNVDGGFGTGPGAESHAGQVFTCVGALAITRRIHLIDVDRVGAWLSERQLPNGGLNGRPEKLEDVCYSWWVLSSLAMIGRLHWIDANKIAKFILMCQDPDLGGFADRPGDMVDVFHTNFGLAGLSLVGFPGLDRVDPIYCMPKSVTSRALGE